MKSTLSATGFTPACWPSSLVAFLTFLNFFLFISCSTSRNCVLFVRLNCKETQERKWNELGKKKKISLLFPPSLAVLQKASWPVVHEVATWFLFLFLLLWIFRPHSLHKLCIWAPKETPTWSSLWILWQPFCKIGNVFVTPVIPSNVISTYFSIPFSQ